MSRPQRSCLGCGTPTRNPAGRCRTCQQNHDRTRNQRRTQYQGSWPALSRAARQAEPWCHCDLEGHGHDGRPCDQTDDLTLDHQYGRVECRSCNSAHRRNRGGAFSTAPVPRPSENSLRTDSRRLGGD